MKLWNAYGSEHSAKLRIIGTFKSVNDAEEAAELFNQLLELWETEPKSGESFSEEMREVMVRNNFMTFNENDPKQLGYFYPLENKGDKIIVDTDELEIQALLKVLINKGAKVEVYSRHDYPGGT